VKYKLQHLGDVCTLIYGGGLKESNREGGSIPVYGSNGIVGYHNKPLSSGETIIIGRKGSIGEIHISRVPCWPIDTTYYVDRTKMPCDFTWLFYILSSLDLTRLNKSAAIPGLNREDAYEQMIPFPPLPEQQRIAAILQKADRLRRLRRYARQLSDGYLQSVFLEMFGDPATNSKGFPFDNLGNVVRINPGIDKKINPINKVTFLPMMGVNELTGKIVYSEEKSFSEVSKGYTPFKENDVLFAKITPCMENGKSTIATHLINGIGFGSTEFHVLRPTEFTSSEWIFWLIRKKEFRQLASKSFTVTAGQQRVPSSFLENFLAPIPPVNIQEKFAIICKEYDQLLQRSIESERQTDMLFQSLLQRAFQGEL